MLLCQSIRVVVEVRFGGKVIKGDFMGLSVIRICGIAIGLVAMILRVFRVVRIANGLVARVVRVVGVVWLAIILVAVVLRVGGTTITVVASGVPWVSGLSVRDRIARVGLVFLGVLVGSVVLIVLVFLV